MKKCLSLAFCITIQTATFVNSSAEPLFQTQTGTTLPKREVTLQEFFKQFTDLRQKADNETWIISCIPKQKDVWELKYSGAAQNKKLEAMVLRLEAGDSIVITTDTKPAKQIVTYVLKQQTTKK